MPGKDFHGPIEQIAGGASVKGRDGLGLPEAERPKVGSVCLLKLRINFVGDKDDGLA